MSDGSVKAWGREDAGGDSSSADDGLKSGVVNIMSNSWAFAALKDDGSIVSWGRESAGGELGEKAELLKAEVSHLMSPFSDAVNPSTPDIAPVLSSYTPSFNVFDITPNNNGGYFLSGYIPSSHSALL